MEKIKDLLVKAGCKTDLVNAIAESLENYKTDLRSRFGTEYAVKVEKAKKVCVEETEAHKRELARRLQIFCETKSAAIEAQLTKMSALSESQATAKLKNVRALLEGVQLNGKQDGRSAAAVEKAQRRIQQLTEEKNKAIAEANRKAHRTIKADNQRKPTGPKTTSPAPNDQASNNESNSSRKPRPTSSRPQRQSKHLLETNRWFQCNRYRSDNGRRSNLIPLF